MRKSIFIVLILLLQNIGFCQERSSLQNVAISQKPVYFESKLSGEVVLPDYGYVGSPYFMNDWLKGEVTLKTGQIVHNKWLRYNGVSDALIWRTDSSFQEVKIDKKLISEFVLGQANGSVKYYFRKIKVPSRNKDDSIDVFAQILVNSNRISLYAIRKVIIEGHVPHEVSGTLILRQLLTQDPYYYVVIQEKVGTRFKKINRRAILSMLPEYADKIKSMLKEYNNKLRSEQELIDAVKAISIFMDRN
jgi:hypothetical protein